MAKTLVDITLQTLLTRKVVVLAAGNTRSTPLWWSQSLQHDDDEMKTGFALCRMDLSGITNTQLSSLHCCAETRGHKDPASPGLQLPWNPWQLLHITTETRVFHEQTSAPMKMKWGVVLPESCGRCFPVQFSSRCPCEKYTHEYIRRVFCARTE